MNITFDDLLEFEEDDAANHGYFFFNLPRNNVQQVPPHDRTGLPDGARFALSSQATETTGHFTNSPTDDEFIEEDEHKVSEFGHLEGKNSRKISMTGNSEKILSYDTKWLRDGLGLPYSCQATQYSDHILASSVVDGEKSCQAGPSACQAISFIDEATSDFVASQLSLPPTESSESHCNMAAPTDGEGSSISSSHNARLALATVTNPTDGDASSPLSSTRRAVQPAPCCTSIRETTGGDVSAQQSSSSNQTQVHSVPYLIIGEIHVSPSPLLSTLNQNVLSNSSSMTGAIDDQRSSVLDQSPMFIYINRTVPIDPSVASPLSEIQPLPSTHSIGQEHQCHTCLKHFSERSQLLAHAKTHSVEIKHQCPVCSKQFSSSSHLRRHARIHTGEKPYQCQICSKSFAELDRLKVHARIHPGEKPYKCKFCSKCFRNSYNSRIHSRTHTGEKTHQCQICLKHFGRRADLRKHGKIFHELGGPIVCKICSKHFSSSFHLRRHSKTHRGYNKQKNRYILPACSIPKTIILWS